MKQEGYARTNEGCNTDYGFSWGPLEVARLVRIEGRGYILEVLTDYGSLEVYVSEAGRVIRPFSHPGDGRKARKKRSDEWEKRFAAGVGVEV